MTLYPGQVEWHGDKAYARCEDCRKVVQLNKRFGGALHLCLTPCEKYGHKPITTHKWWRKDRVECERCQRVMA